MFDRVDAQLKFATGEVVDKGVAKHIAWDSRPSCAVLATDVQKLF
jgi:hypothetical protein